MKIPIRLYGDPILKKECEEIEQDYPKLKELVINMFETMYAASGIGLAAPQIGLPIRVFIVDASPMAEDEEYEDIKSELKKFKNCQCSQSVSRMSSNNNQKLDNRHQNFNKSSRN